MYSSSRSDPGTDSGVTNPVGAWSIEVDRSSGRSLPVVSPATWNSAAPACGSAGLAPDISGGSAVPMDDDDSWRTGPVTLAKAAAAESAKRAEATRYSAFGRRPELIIQNPSNRRLLSELQHNVKPRRLSQGRLRELSTTKLGLQLQERMAALAASDSQLGLDSGSSSLRVGRPRPRSAAASAASSRKPRPRRIRLKEVPAESLAGLRLLLSSCGLPTQYASALACFGFSSVGQLTRATHQNLLDVGLRPGHARALRRLLESSFDSQGLPLTPAEGPSTQVRPASAPAVRAPHRARPASAPPGTVGRDALGTAASGGANYSESAPHGTTAPGASTLATAAPDLEGLISALELTDEKPVPGQAQLSPKHAMAAKIADAAADVAADMLVNHASTAGFALLRGNPAQRPQSARLIGRPTAQAPPAVEKPAKTPAAAGSPELNATAPLTLTLDEMEERLESEVLKLDELEKIEAELQAELARLRVAGTQAGIVTGDGSKIGGLEKPKGSRAKAMRRGIGRGSARGGRRRRS